MAALLAGAVRGNYRVRDHAPPQGPVFPDLRRHRPATRDLPPKESPLFDVNTAAIIGDRDEQQDAVATAPWREDGSDGVIIALADGMGGHADGALAAQLAVEHGLKAFLDSEASLADRLDATWRAANRAIADAAHQSQPGPGRTIGCTFILAAVSESGVAFVSVGDSVIYRWRGGALERLNEDHSYGAILETEVRAGLMTQAEAAANPRRHRLVSALTGDRVPCVDLQAEAIQLDAGDRLLIASDGIIALGMEDAARLMDGEAAEEIARALLQTLREGTTKNLDNTTVAVVMRQDR